MEYPNELFLLKNPCKNGLQKIKFVKEDISEGYAQYQNGKKIVIVNFNAPRKGQLKVGSKMYKVDEWAVEYSVAHYLLSREIRSEKEKLLEIIKKMESLLKE
jgi:hypothetical protein